MVIAVSIYGPPGTGKTDSLIREARSLLSTTTIKFLSHTRAAAQECVARIGDPEMGSTIHSLCFRLLGLSRQSVVTPARLQGFGDEIGIRVTGSVEEATQDEGDEYLTILGYARNVGVSPFECYDRFGRPGNAGNFSVFISAYTQWKDIFGFVDFNDMLERFIHRDIKVDFKTMMVDEAQDLSPLQWAVVDKIVPQLDKIYIAGDDDQTIYTWSGADPQGMQRFDEKYKANRRILNQSFRVPRVIHAMAQRVIKRTSVRVDKEYSPAPREGKIGYYNSLESLRFGDKITLLARDNYKINDIEKILLAQKVPYLVQGSRGVLNKPYGRAMIVWRKLENGATISEEEKKALYYGVDDSAKKSIVNNDFQSMVKRGWAACIKMPISVMDFFHHADLTQEPMVYLSTIHGAKGTEAENVAVYTARSPRVMDSFERDPDPEHRLFYVAATRAIDNLVIVDGVDGYPYPM